MLDLRLLGRPRFALAAGGLVAVLAAGLYAFGIGEPARLAVAVFETDSAKNPPVTVLASASRVEKRTFKSDSLGREMAFNIYLPPGYDSSSDARFPVLYMLHGLEGDQNAWAGCGLYKAADQAIASGTVTPMIIVTPAGERGYWLNHANGGPRYGNYVAWDLVGLIDKEYRTLAYSASRAVGGMSMGGHGALQLAMNYPDIFGVAGAHSVALRRYDQAFSFMGDQKYFRRLDPVALFKEFQTQAKRTELWIDIGRADPWFAAAEAFHNQLVSEGVEHEWRAYDGGHDTAYWSTHTPEYLMFYSNAFVSTGADSFSRAHR